jgi:hypothetical protein
VRQAGIAAPIFTYSNIPMLLNSLAENRSKLCFFAAMVVAVVGVEEGSSASDDMQLNVSNLPVTSHSSEPAPTAAMAELSALLTRPVSNAAIQMTAIGNLRPAALGRVPTAT